MAYKSCAFLPATCYSATYFARFWLRYDVPNPSSPPELLVVGGPYCPLMSNGWETPTSCTWSPLCRDGVAVMQVHKVKENAAPLFFFLLL